MRFCRLQARLVLVALPLLLAVPARALPPDRVIRMAPSGDQFEKGYQGSWESIAGDDQVVQAQSFDTMEVFLQAGKSGTALVILKNKVLRQVKFWKVRVGEAASKPMLPDPKSLPESCACGDKKAFPLVCRVESEKCLNQLRDFLKDSDLSSDDLQVQYGVSGAQALLKQLQSSLAQAGFLGIELAFAGANLRMSGKVADEQAWDKLILVLYQGMVGRLILEDQIDLQKKTSNLDLSTH